MAVGMKVVSLDWRKFGDFSAVGQLTKKLFTARQGLNLHPIQCLDDGVSCNVFTYSDEDGLRNQFDRKLSHDAVLNHIRKLSPDVLYVRLSSHKSTMELACKMAVALPHVALIVHYMDKLSLDGVAPSRAAYIKQMYRFLVLRSDSFYTIHESSQQWLKERYGRKASVIANFIAQDPEPRNNMKMLRERPLRVSYFGSIDRKMNAGAIASVCRAVSNQPWINLSIWTNSGIWGEVKKACEKSSNIQVSTSNLDEVSFRAQLKAADLLLLPYNLDLGSVDFLKHSFSNKFVDYLEAGGVLLCLGSREIPTVEACISSGLSLVIETEAELVKAFSSKDTFFARLDALDLSKQSQRLQLLKTTQQQLVTNFFEDLWRLAEKSRALRQISDTSKGEKWIGGALESKQLAFLIRRKFYDFEKNQQQSLSASLMARLIKSKGYRGINYEI